MNPKPSFQSRSIRINPSLDLSKPNFQSESIRMNQRSEWFGLISFGLNQSELGLIRIENLVSDWFGFSRIRSDRSFYRFSPNELQNVFRIGSEWLIPLARIQILEWIGIVLIGSEWIPIWYFRQGSNHKKISFFDTLCYYCTKNIVKVVVLSKIRSLNKKCSL